MKSSTLEIKSDIILLKEVWKDGKRKHSQIHISNGNWQIRHPQWHYITLSVSYSVVSDSLQPHELQHTRPPCASWTPGVCSNSRPLSRWCHPTISSSVAPFSTCLQSFPASGSFQMSQFFPSGGQIIGISASALVLPMNIQDTFCLRWTGWISLLFKELSRVFSNTTVQEHQLCHPNVP